MRKKVILGIVFLVLGIIFLLNPFSGITGFVIFESITKNASSILGLTFFIVGLLLILIGRAEKESELEESIKEAVEQGVPEKEAKELFEEVNRKVESGEWIELYHEEPRYGRAYPYSTSVIRYFGPKSYLKEGQISISRSKAERMFEKGIIGKAHEVVRGSDLYKMHYIKKGKKYAREPDTSIRPSYPFTARILHRDWEIAEMYRKKKKSEK